MSSEDHEELSPLHRLEWAIKARLETNELHADRHPDAAARYDSKIRAEVYRLVLAEIFDAIDTVAKMQVDRLVAAKKSPVVVTEAAVRAMNAAKVT